jgi:hypothetical protein
MNSAGISGPYFRLSEAVCPRVKISDPTMRQMPKLDFSGVSVSDVLNTSTRRRGTTSHQDQPTTRLTASTPRPRIRASTTVDWC